MDRTPKIPAEIPIYSESITVAGEVFEPGAFRYEEGNDVDDYIDLAAGVTKRANLSAAYVINADGSVTSSLKKRRRIVPLRFNGETNFVKPGAVIVIPTNQDYEPILERYKSITSVVFESVTTLAALFSLTD